MLGQDEFIKDYQKRLPFLSWMVIFSFVIVLSRLAWLQIINGDKFVQFSEENRVRRIELPAPRGMVLDRNHQLMVDNRPTFDVQITPQYLRNLTPENQEKVIEKLASYINYTPEQIKKSLKESAKEATYKPVKIKYDISREEVALIEMNKLTIPSVEVSMEIKRTYIEKDTGAHLLGYLGEVGQNEIKTLNRRGGDYKMGDVVGKFALERQWEKELRGQSGLDFIEVDAYGRKKSKKDAVLDWVKRKAVVPGNNLILTIDQDLQIAAREALRGKVGGLIALDPNTGEVLAQVSTPSFDPTEFSRGPSAEIWNKLVNNEDRPMRDKTYQDHYMPGSTFKALTAIAALEEGVIDENTTFFCPGYMTLGNRRYHCHSKSGHGNLNVVEALEKSCDVFFYRTAHKLGIDTLARYAFMFGMGKKTGVGYKGEAKGLIPTTEWKMKTFGEEWITGETLSCGIGQSFILTTPLQLANFFAAIGNGGKLYKPFVVKRIESSSSELIRSFQPTLISEIKLKPKTIELVKRGLWNVVNGEHGTARRVRTPGLEIAGKTGTSQVVHFAADKIYQKCEDLEERFRHHGLFVAFAPVNNPKIVAAVVAEHACSGSRGAAPIALAVIKTYLEKYFKEHPEEAPATYLSHLESQLSRRKRSQKTKSNEPQEKKGPDASL